MVRILRAKTAVQGSKTPIFRIFSQIYQHHSLARPEITKEVFLSKNDGMAKDCVINSDHIQTVSKGKIGSLITTLSPGKMKQVREAILFSLNL